jgi:hypothetical protein
MAACRSQNFPSLATYSACRPQHGKVTRRPRRANALHARAEHRGPQAAARGARCGLQALDVGRVVCVHQRAPARLAAPPYLSFSTARATAADEGADARHTFGGEVGGRGGGRDASSQYGRRDETRPVSTGGGGGWGAGGGTFGGRARRPPGSLRAAARGLRAPAQPCAARAGLIFVRSLRSARGRGPGARCEETAGAAGGAGRAGRHWPTTTLIGLRCGRIPTR